MHTKPHALLRLSFFAFWVAQVLIAATVVTVMYARDRQTWIIISGYIGSVALVLDVWAIVLALRAFWNGDQTRWWRVVPFYVLLELNFGVTLAYGRVGADDRISNLGDLIVATGLPLFLPFFSIVGLLAAPIASWLAARSQRREPLQVLRYTAAVAAVLSAFLLPIPLLLYCACPPDEFPTDNCYLPKPPAPGWRTFVADWTPNPVRDAALELSIYLPWPTRARCMNTILIHGRCSRAQLFSHLYASTFYSKSYDWIDDRDCAFEGLAQSEPSLARDLAFDISHGDAQRALCDRIAWRAGRFLARTEKGDAIRALLKDASEPNLVLGIIDEIADSKRTEFIPALRDYADDKLNDEWCAGPRPRVGPGIIFSLITAQSKMESAEQFIRQWSALLADPNRKIPCRLSLHFFDHLRPVRLRFEPIMNAWDSANSMNRRVLLNEALIQTDRESNTLSGDDLQSQCTWLNWLIAHWNNDDIVIRRAVAHRIAEGVGYELKHTWQACTHTRRGSSAESQECWNDESVYPDNPIERSELEHVCNLARDYVAKFAPSTRVTLTPSPRIPPSPPAGASEPTGTALSQAR